MQPNPDSVLAVRFYQREVENEYLTTQEGRPIKYMADFVRIEVPGNMTSIIDTVANDGHKKRFPIQWAQFLNEKTSGGESSDVQGTLLRDWSLLTSAQASELRHFKFYTVEQVANASDQQIHSLGMAVGMSPFAFRDKAKAYLANAKDSGVVMAQAEELKKRDLQIQEMQDQIARLMASMAQPGKRGPGRPKKEAEEA
jgi:hypothetical protein